MLITATTIARYRKLADDLDAALERSDEIGMDLLKSMLPELGEAIEEINEALRAVDALLFDGLRDEAVGLHDSELVTIAPRLHLEDKPQWPLIAMQFSSEGITSPPAIDFTALSALNAAYSELNALRKPLDSLRRLALERAPLTSRISLLRKLRKHDSVKPVWGEQLSAHEEVRILELGESVKQALVTREPEKLAAFHQELMSPGWSIPIPARLKQDTRGADSWERLRQGVRTLEITADQLASEFADREAEGGDAFECIERLKRLRYAWLSGEHECRDLLFGLPQHPTVARLSGPENFGPRLDALREKVAPALQWLGELDQREQLIEQFRTVCNELEWLTETLPTRREESRWLAQVEQLESDLQQIAQQLPHLKVPESLPLKVERAVAAVRHRSQQRVRARLVTAGVGLGVMAIVVGAGMYLLAAKRLRNEATDYLASLIPLARQGEYVVRPELLDGYALRYGADSGYAQSLDEFDGLVELEVSRRESFDALLAEHDMKITAASEIFAERERDPAQGLEEWPEEVFEAKKLYDAARLKGGFPSKRKTGRGSRGQETFGEEAISPAARQRLDDEETRLAEHFDKQARLERGFTNAAIVEFSNRLTNADIRLKSAEARLKEKAPESGGELRDLFREINELLEVAKKPQHSTYESTSRIPFGNRESAKPLQERLEWLVGRVPEDEAVE